MTSARSSDPGATDLREIVAEILSDDRVAATIYFDLLLEGARAIRDLDGKYGSKSAQARRRLSHLGLVAARNTQEGKTLFALEPKRVWTALGASIAWTKATSFSSVDRPADTGDPSIDRLRALCLEVAESAQPLWASGHIVSRTHPVAAETAEDLAGLTTDAIRQARRQVRAMSRSPRLPQVALFWATLTERMANGVVYRRIADVAELADHGLTVVRRDILETNVQLRVSLSSQLRTCYLIDTRFLVLHDQRSEDRTSPLAGVVTPHNGLIVRYGRTFEERWNRSIEALQVVAVLQARADDLIEAASRSVGFEAVRYLDDLVRDGKFSAYGARRGLSVRELQNLQGELQRHELIRSGPDGVVTPNYGSEAGIMDRSRHHGHAEPVCQRCWDLVRRCCCED